jgi:uncharacterized protein YjbI with pentapeptide repeats
MSATKVTSSTFNEITFSDSKIIGIDWTKSKSTRFLSFQNTQLNYSNFSFLKLHTTNISSCAAKDVDFTEADLTESNFEKTNFESSKFLKTNLTKVNFKNAYNYSIDFHSNIIKKASFSMPEAMSLLNSLDIILE